MPPLLLLWAGLLWRLGLRLRSRETLGARPRSSQCVWWGLLNIYPYVTTGRPVGACLCARVGGAATAAAVVLHPARHHALTFAVAQLRTRTAVLSW